MRFLIWFSWDLLTNNDELHCVRCEFARALVTVLLSFVKWCWKRGPERFYRSHHVHWWASIGTLDKQGQPRCHGAATSRHERDSRSRLWGVRSMNSFTNIFMSVDYFKFILSSHSLRTSTFITDNILFS